MNHLPLLVYDSDHTNENFINLSSIANSNIYFRNPGENQGNYLIYQSGNYVGILDITANKSVPIDKSCFEKISDDEKGKGFLNNLVDLTGGPYKAINPVENKHDTFQQSFSSGGGGGTEGTIKVFFNKDLVRCNIEVKFTPMAFD